MVDTDTIIRKNRTLTRMVFIALIALMVAAALAYYIYSLSCPCDRTPGGVLFGERINEQITDWSIVNDVELCQLQIAAGIRPHSLNLNCWATPEGELYVGCMSCENKYWGYQVAPNENGFIRIAGRVYPVTLNRIEALDEMDQIWRSRFFKLRHRSSEPVPETPRAEGWWAFSVVSRPT